MPHFLFRARLSLELLFVASVPSAWVTKIEQMPWARQTSRKTPEDAGGDIHGAISSPPSFGSSRLLVDPSPLIGEEKPYEEKGPEVRVGLTEPDEMIWVEVVRKLLVVEAGLPLAASKPLET
jgi:hypothetical protein